MLPAFLVETPIGAASRKPGKSCGHIVVMGPFGNFPKGKQAREYIP
jgi:hypothetical protein